jgi:DeoR/GlpR family transcriptional regulator of sugar metabolism
VLAVERRARIVEALHDARSVSTEELSRRLDVSVETIRRDLVALEDQGLLERVHGGAAIPDGRLSGVEPSFPEREHTNAAVKQRIALDAVRLLGNGQTVMIDVGTTALAVARAIPASWTGTVVTCSLLAAVELAGRPDLEVLVCGGRVRGGDLTLSNHVARQFFEGVYPDLAFLGSGGVDAEVGLTDYYLDEIEVRRTVIRNSRNSWILADSSKFGHIAQHAVAPLKAVTGLITDRMPDERLAQAITDDGGAIRVA